MAVSDLVEKKVKIVDRFGYNSYLREDRGTLFLKTDYPLNLFEKEGAVSVSECSEEILKVARNYDMKLIMYISDVTERANKIDSSKVETCRRRNFFEILFKRVEEAVGCRQRMN